MTEPTPTTDGPLHGHLVRALARTSGLSEGRVRELVLTAGQHTRDRRLAAVPDQRPTTVYVAGPMTGYPDHNYPAFHAAASELEAAGYRVLNPARDDGREGCTTWLDYMRAALRDVADADALAVLPGWEGSRGAALEVDLAIRLGLPVQTVDEWTAA